MAVKINLWIIAEDCVCVWDKETVKTLRSDYRILGELIGCLNGRPLQNLHLGIPLMLRPEEVALLIEIGVGNVVRLSEIHLNISGESSHNYSRFCEQNAVVQSQLRRLKKNFTEERFREVISVGQNLKRQGDLRLGRSKKTKQRQQVMINDMIADRHLREAVGYDCDILDNVSDTDVDECCLGIPRANDDSTVVSGASLNSNFGNHESDSSQICDLIDGNVHNRLEAEAFKEPSNLIDDAVLDKEDNLSNVGVDLPANFTLIKSEPTTESGQGISPKPAIEGGQGTTPEPVIEGGQGTMPEPAIEGGTSGVPDVSPKVDRFVVGNIDKMELFSCKPSKIDDDNIDMDGVLHKASVHIATESLHCAFGEQLNSVVPVNWSLPVLLRNNYLVYRTLWRKGYYLTGGSKFGCDFLAYPGDPLRFHACYMCVVVSLGELLDAKYLSSISRLATTVNKSVLFCIVSHEQSVSLVGCQWSGILSRQ